MLALGFTNNMKNIHIILIFITLLGCASHKTGDNKKSYEIIDSISLKLNKSDSIQANELRFKPKFSSADLQKFLFNKYGKWNNLIKTDRDQNILVWENIRLLENSEELFTIAASGEDRKFEIIKINGIQKYGRIFYCSAIVFNSKNVDCLQSASELKDSLAEYLISRVNSVNKKNELFEKEINSN